LFAEAGDNLDRKARGVVQKLERALYHCHRAGKKDIVMKAINFLDARRKTTWLQDNEYYEEAAMVLAEYKGPKEAAKYLFQLEMYNEASGYFEKVYAFHLLGLDLLC